LVFLFNYLQQIPHGILAHRTAREGALATGLRLLTTTLPQVVGWWQYEYAFDRLTEILPKMVNITDNEMRGSRRYRRQKNGYVLVGQSNFTRK
jgi:hypothetical protein